MGAKINSKRSARKEISWAFTIGSFVVTWFRKTMLELGRTEEVIREMDRLANEDHTHICHRRRTQRIPWQLVDTFKFWGFRHDARKASSWFQRSIVYLASPQESRGSSLLPKLVAKHFLVLVELARFLVASFIWDITATMDPALIDRGNLRKQCLGLIIRGKSLKLIWCRITVTIAVYCHRRGV